jgi:hypothetical protein
MTSRVARLLLLLRRARAVAPPETTVRPPDRTPPVPSYERAVRYPPETR